MAKNHSARTGSLWSRRFGSMHISCSSFSNVQRPRGDGRECRACSKEAHASPHNPLQARDISHPSCILLGWTAAKQTACASLPCGPLVSSSQASLRKLQSGHRSWLLQVPETFPDFQDPSSETPCKHLPKPYTVCSSGPSSFPECRQASECPVPAS